MPAPTARALARGFTLTGPPPGFVDDPYPFYAALRAHAPVHEMAPGSLLLTRHDDVAAMYRDPAASSDKRREFAPRFGAGTPLYEHHTTSLVFNDAPLHTRVRRPIVTALNPRALARMEAPLVALVDALLDRLAALPAPDLIDDYAARIPLEVIGNLLDIPPAERGPLRDWSLAILSALEPAPSPAVLGRGHAAVDEFKAYLRGLVAERRRHPGDIDTDVLTRLIHGDGEPLSDTELLHQCIFLLNAGHETTTNLIGNGVHALLVHRGEFDRLRADPALITTAVEELLRFESPLQLNNRVTTAPVTLGGRDWPAGTFVTLGIGAANRDPAVFADPDRLDIARKPNPHLAFGHGAHACAGMNVARLEARIAVGRLVARFPRVDLAAPPERDPRIRFRGFRRLPVRIG
ncbi:MAG: cytochrome P450 [Gammaproteobacteria bacterium]|uniref:cytochrome P450 n=1 Tax=Azohydromonas sp. TaxID=1872666 RepID=UPI002BE48B0C|nr:cytochrome P450 [Azohydromonas sp.]HMM84094.1 cytochrome P450 [Azohydromonas sp.]